MNAILEILWSYFIYFSPLMIAVLLVAVRSRAKWYESGFVLTLLSGPLCIPMLFQAWLAAAFGPDRDFWSKAILCLAIGQPIIWLPLFIKGCLQKRIAEQEEGQP